MKKNMLRFIATAAALASVCTGSALHVSAEEIITPDRIMGDLDYDCRVTLYDCLSAVDIYNNILLGLEDETINDANYPIDIDMDGSITLSDLIAMYGYYALELAGVQPLWADFREVSYVDGTDISTDVPFALRGMYVEIGCASGKAGEEVTVPVYIAGAEKLAGFTYAQNIPAGYEVTDVTTDLYTNNQLTFNPRYAEDKAAVVWVSSDGLNFDIHDGLVLAYFTYRIPEDAQPGDTHILTADPAYNDFVTEDGLSYQYTMVNGVITVE